MKFKIIFKTSRKVTIELEGAGIYYTKKLSKIACF